LMATKIRVLIADDHAVLRDGLKVLLESGGDIQVVGMAGSGREAVSEAVRLRPDVAVLDLTMPELNGIDAARHILRRHPEVQVLILSMYHSAEHVHRALAAGARGYVLKESAGTEVVDAVRSIHSGQRFFSPRITDVVIDAYRSGHLDSPLERLSAREREVLQLTVEGRSSAEIAVRLSLSRKTVETYRGRVMEKLGVGDRVALIRFAIEHGLTPPA
jgi:DNA-binding NarL/FixJ family response regulator